MALPALQNMFHIFYPNRSIFFETICSHDMIAEMFSNPNFHLSVAHYHQTNILIRIHLALTIHSMLKSDFIQNDMKIELFIVSKCFLFLLKFTKIGRLMLCSDFIKFPNFRLSSIKFVFSDVSDVDDFEYAVYFSKAAVFNTHTPLRHHLK